MAQEWLVELLKGLGSMFLNPVFYYVFFLAAILGVSRVKRERRNFHVRAENAYFELRQVLPPGIVLGLILSIITIGTGLVIPIEVIIFCSLLTVLWSFTTKMRLLSPIYTVGFAFFAAIIFLSQDRTLPYIQSYTPEWSQDILPPIAVLLTLLMIAEGILIIVNGSRGTSPKLIKSKRGLMVGIHEVKRIWLLPVFLVIPSEALAAPFEWWPVFSVTGESYSLLLVPFAIGYSQRIQTMLPVEAVKQVGKKVLVLGVMLTCIAIVGYWYPITSIVIVALAIIGREMISLRQRLLEDGLPLYFSKKNQVIMILGIIPESPADKMGLAVGEMVTKVNGAAVNDEDSFYEALQQNRAHCKLEVLDVNGQIRFVQRALYEGDHYELGILFVPDERKAGQADVL